MRWPMLVLAAVLIAERPAVAGDDVWREQSQKEVDVRGLSSLEIINPRGRVDLLPSPDARLHISALKIVRVGRRGRAQEVAAGIVVEAGPRGDRYLVEVRHPMRRRIHLGLSDLFTLDHRAFPQSEVRIEARIPPGMSAIVRETSGDIRSEDVAGPQLLSTTSGDIDVRSARNRVELSTSSGDVSADGLRSARVRSVSGDLIIREVAGPLVASSSSGDITVTDAADSLSLSTVSGDIDADRAPRGLRAESSSGTVEVRAVSGSARVSTSSGDVTLGLRGPLSGVDVSASSGELRLDLDPAVRCALDLKTSSGSLHVSLPMEMSHASRRALSGTIGGGRSPVVLRTSSGDITVMGGGR